MTSSRCTSPDRINWEDWIHLSDLYSSARDTILDRSIEDTYSPSPHIISIGESSNVTEGSFQIVKSNSNHIINDPQPNLEASSVPSPKIHQSFLIQSTGKKAVINSTEEKQMPKQLTKSYLELQEGLLPEGNPVIEEMMDKIPSSLPALENLREPAASSVSDNSESIVIFDSKDTYSTTELALATTPSTKDELALATTPSTKETPQRDMRDPLIPQELIIDLTGSEDELETITQTQARNSSSPQKLVIDLTESEDELETITQTQAQNSRLDVKASGLRKRKHSDVSTASPDGKRSSRRTRRKQTFQNYLIQEKTWMSRTLEWIAHRINEDDGGTIMIKRSDLLELKNEVEGWCIEDLNATKKLELSG